MADLREPDFSGTWHSRYQYINPLVPGVCDSEHDVTINQDGENLVVESHPNTEKSYLLMRLKLDGRVATGTWQESTSPTGSYEGQIYTGAAQLVLSDDGNVLYGMYVAADRRVEVRSGYWKITRQK